MNKPATTSCTNKLKCHCYKCSLINAIKTTKIIDHVPNDLIVSIINYIGKYVIYGKFKNEYKIIPQISNIIYNPNDIYFHSNHLFIHSQNNDIFHSFIAHNIKINL